MAKKTITDKELEILFGDSAGEVKIAGKEFPIYPFNVKQTGIVVKKIGVLIPILSNHIDVDGSVTLPSAVLIGLITESFDAVVEIVAMTLDLDVELVERLDIDTLLRVVLEIIRVNKSFFVDRVESTIQKATETMPGLMTLQSEN